MSATEHFATQKVQNNNEKTLHSIFSNVSSLSRKNVVGGIIVIFLIFGLLATLVAVKHSTEIRQHASGYSPMYIVNGVIKGNPATQTRMLIASVVGSGCASNPNTVTIPPNATTFNMTISDNSCSSGAVTFEIETLDSNRIIGKQQAAVAFQNSSFPFHTQFPKFIPANGTPGNTSSSGYNYVQPCVNNNSCPSGYSCELHNGQPVCIFPTVVPPQPIPINSPSCLPFTPGKIITSKNPGSDVGELYVIPGGQQDTSCAQSGVRIDSLSPTSGSIGTVVTIHGSGFYPSNNNIVIDNKVDRFISINNVLSSDGKTLTFTFPANMARHCETSTDPHCQDTSLPATSGIYQVYVTHGTVSSNQGSYTSLPFTLLLPGAKLPPCGTYGDVDGDGVITQNDATEILRHVAGLPPLVNYNAANANVDGSGTVTSVDALYIQRYLEGLPTIKAGVTLSSTPSLPVCFSNPPQHSGVTISSISPSFGSVGTKVTLTGSGFSSTSLIAITTDSSGNSGGFINNGISFNETSLTFTLPQYVDTKCGSLHSIVFCNSITQPINLIPGKTIYVSVFSDDQSCHSGNSFNLGNCFSNTVPFTVTAANNIPTPTPPSCVECAAPPQGCNYQGASCSSCGTLVCNNPTSTPSPACVVCEEPNIPQGCTIQEASCTSCGELVCVIPTVAPGQGNRP